MQFLLERSKFYKIGDKVYIEYWYNDMIVPVIIKNIKGNKYLVSHNIKESKIFNAPDELIRSIKIISKI